MERDSKRKRESEPESTSKNLKSYLTTHQFNCSKVSAEFQMCHSLIVPIVLRFVQSDEKDVEKEPMELENENLRDENQKLLDQNKKLRDQLEQKKKLEKMRNFMHIIDFDKQSTELSERAMPFHKSHFKLFGTQEWRDVLTNCHLNADQDRVSTSVPVKVLSVDNEHREVLKNLDLLLGLTKDDYSCIVPSFDAFPSGRSAKFEQYVKELHRMKNRRGRIPFPANKEDLFRMFCMVPVYRNGREVWNEKQLTIRPEFVVTRDRTFSRNNFKVDEKLSQTSAKSVAWTTDASCMPVC